MTANPHAANLRTNIVSKVPEISVLFWVVKVLTTGMGETISDYLVKTYDPVLVVLIAAVLFVICLLIQLRARRYVPWRYWLVVTLVSIFGTMVADVAHIVVGIPYLVSAVGFAIVLAAVFLVWFRYERTLSIHSITSLRRELFYWAAVIVTFALGTATGDLTATTFGLGYLASGILFAILIALPGLGYRFLRLGAVPAFWIAYILTRPLGASFADWLAVSRQRGGLDLGTGPVSLVALALVVAGVIALSVLHRGQTRSREAQLA